MKFRVAICVILYIVPVVVFGADFTRTLYVGMRGEDVRLLQVLLNSDVDTRVAEAGSGSKGKETDYFGPVTKRALIRFQEKYRAEILTPVGLVSGNGVFGVKTRAKASALKGATSVTNPVIVVATPTKATTTPVVEKAVEKGDVIVMFPSQYSGKPGTMITLSGAGFTATDNTIYFGDGHAVEKAVSWNGQNITFKVPSIPKGVYPIFVKNARGESDKGAFFVVTDGVTPEPKIDTVDPERATRGGTVTIRGTGFTSTGNTLRTGVGFFENTPSTDGASLSFTIPMNVFPATTSPDKPKFSYPIWINVTNENGVSNEKSFILER